MTERRFPVRDLSRVREVFATAYAIGKCFDKPFEIVLRFLKDKRSGPQNKRMWQLLRDVAATVWLPNDAGVMRQFLDVAHHENFKRMFIGVEEITLPSGEVMMRGLSTTTLSVEEMTRYQEQIEVWCSEQGYPVMQEGA